jgi:hypothetical protein
MSRPQVTATRSLIGISGTPLPGTSTDNRSHAAALLTSCMFALSFRPGQTLTGQLTYTMLMSDDCAAVEARDSNLLFELIVKVRATRELMAVACCTLSLAVSS